MLSFTLSGKHIHGRPITLIVTSLYICISYNYTYSYNFYYLSSLHAYSMSTFFPLHVLCLWYSSYLYFSCISVSILCIFHIHSITYCSMYLTYLLSILSYLNYFHITYLILFYTFIYILILSYTVLLLLSPVSSLFHLSVL